MAVPSAQFHGLLQTCNLINIPKASTTEKALFHVQERLIQFCLSGSSLGTEVQPIRKTMCHRCGVESVPGRMKQRSDQFFLGRRTKKGFLERVSLVLGHERQVSVYQADIRLLFNKIRDSLLSPFYFQSM